MITIFFIIIEIVFFLINLIIFIKLSKKANKIKVILFYLLNLFLIALISELFNQMRYYLRDNKIYIETGHGSIPELVIFFIFILLTTIAFIYLFFKKK